MAAGQACSGPFDVNAQSELGWEIERNHMLPMPDQWLPYLKPAIAVYNVDRSRKSFTMWYDWPDTMKWYDTTYRERRKKPIDPKYTITYELKKSKLIRDEKQTWTMCDQSDKKLYTYFERIDGKTGRSSKKTMTAYKGASTTPTFKQDNTSNSLSFTDPASGTFYRWISNRPISTINGERFDFQRNALFRTHNGTEVLVADFSWYDGHLECEDALTIRDPSVSHALVIASLTLLHGHHWTIMHDEFKLDPDAVNKAHECARLTEIGKKQYFKESEDGGQVQSGKKGKSGVDWKAVSETLHGVNGVLDGVNSIVAADSGGGGGGDGGGGGGGGDGGGGGGVC
ncbi:hypothetical protein FB567DRAFT_587787 [Paraphoma chrysanthemicola]|uniref:Uncharacterized protein n=1 Tax=Paraphoma chrysanthemicola TaxID=798071 RepID=A0A8K0RI24_9PLEO|nr:hypothetical protein FB567DRAFT_587787 [Paraphoma chrysanthemicola]